MANFIVDPTSISFPAIREDLVAFIQAAPDSARWKDFFASSTGKLLIDSFAAVSTFLVYNATVARREAFPRHAKNRSSVIAYGESVGYSSYRGRNAILKINVTPNVTGVWEKWKILGSVKDVDLVLQDETIVNSGVPVDIYCIVGEIKTQALTAVNQNPNSFRFTQDLVSDDVRVYLNAVEQVYSERLLDLINEQWTVQSNVLGSVDVMYLNLDTFITRFNTGDAISINWIELRNLTFVLTDPIFDFGDMNTLEVFKTYDEPEPTETIRINAPLYNETQFTIRGRNDYLKIFRLLDATIIDTSGKDVSPAVVELFYIRQNYCLFSAADIASLLIQLESSRPFGVSPPTISHPTIVFFAIDISVKLKSVGGNVIADVGSVIDTYENKLGNTINFDEIENAIERFTYVQVGRATYRTEPWTASKVYRRGNIVVPTSPSIAQLGFVYEQVSKVYLSAATEPGWFDNPSDGDIYLDENALTSNGTAAKLTHGGVKFEAINPGVAGNGISLVFDGFDTVQQVVTDWNNDALRNQIKFSPASAASSVLSAGTFALTGGAEASGAQPGENGAGTGLAWTVKPKIGTPAAWVPGTRYETGDTAVPSILPVGWTDKMVCVSGFVNRGNGDVTGKTATASSAGIFFFACGGPGTIGNTITLIFNGIDTVSAVVSAWNLANPLNKVCFTGSGATVLVPQTVTLAGGAGTQATATDSGVTFTATMLGANGNLIEIGPPDGVSTANLLVANWNLLNPTNTVIISPPAAGTTVIPLSLVPISLAGGSSATVREPSWPIPVGDLPIC